jgi:hypothetical protein
MKFLYDDASFSFEALRATGFADYGGAELGEVLVTCRRPARPTRRTTELLSCNLQLA